MKDLITYLKSLPHMHVPDVDFVNSGAYYPWMSNLAASLKAKHILEVGVWCGFSAVSFIRGNKVTEYTGIDNWSYAPGSVAVVKKNLEFLHKDQEFKFSLHTKDSHKLKNLDFLEDQTFDFIHIDGDHSKDGALQDMRLFWPILAKGGHMLVDDSLYIPEVREACHDFVHAIGMPNYDVRTFRGTWVYFKP